ncbi:hypothetical protein [Aliivibrio sifiae]|uniref:hypothetical protein n=1 Tax=Aliivibrio sifiae TaxID=566293 RepID=UPI003D0AF33C
MAFKTNLKFIALAASISTLSFTAYANTDATATIIWNGAIGETVPGSNLIITGEGGGDIASGTLYIEDDGTFTSSSVGLQARDYTPEVEGMGGEDAIVGDIQPDASWSYMSSTVMIDGQVSQEAAVKVTDLQSGVEFIKGGQGSSEEIKAGMIELSISNSTPVTDVDVTGDAQVSVLMAASYEAGL